LQNTLKKKKNYGDNKNYLFHIIQRWDVVDMMVW